MSDSSDPMDCSPPGSSVHGIFQAKVLEWDAIAFSKASPSFIQFYACHFPPRCISYLYSCCCWPCSASIPLTWTTNQSHNQFPCLESSRSTPAPPNLVSILQPNQYSKNENLIVSPPAENLSTSPMELSTLGIKSKLLSMAPRALHDLAPAKSSASFLALLPFHT